MNRISLTIAFAVCFLSYSFVVPPDLKAKKLLSTASLKVRGEYDDNVTFVARDAASDYVLTLSPFVPMTYDSELLHLDSKIGLDILQYRDLTDLDTVNQFYDLNGLYRFRERWSFTGLISFIKDTTLDSYLLETGRVSTRENRRRFDIDGGLSYQVTELSDLGINFHAKQVKYDSDSSVDYDLYSVALAYNRKLNNQVDILSVLPRYSHRSSDVSDLDDFNLLFGWKHIFSPRIQFYIAGGVDYLSQDFKFERSTNRNWEIVGQTYLRDKGEVSVFEAGFRRDIRTSTTDQALTVNRLYLTSHWRLTRRFEIVFVGSLIYSSDVDQSFDDGVRYFQLRPAINFKLTKNHFLQLSYRYSNEYAKRNDDPKSDRNQIWLGLNFNFPKEWEF